MPYVPLFESGEGRYVLPFIAKNRLMELGGGKNPVIRPNVDIMIDPSVDVVHDLSIIPWPLESNSLDGVFCQYCIEHMEWKKVFDFINELYRILDENGTAVIFTSNLFEQCKKIVQDGVNQGAVELIFGSQEFPNYGGCHKCGFSPEYAVELFKKAGFNMVNVLPHPISKTDMIIEAYKMKEMFEREYFEDGTIGYREYRDFCTHYTTARWIAKLRPESVLDVGCGRGYLVRILENEGIKAMGLDISNHCWHTRATDSFILCDVTKTPWSIADPLKLKKLSETFFKEKEFDLCFSSNLLEHIPEETVDAVIKEMICVSKRGLHAIHFTDHPYQEVDKDMDATHVTMKTKQWWLDKFKAISPDYPVQIEYPRTIEYEKPWEQPPMSIAPGAWTEDGKVKCVDPLHKLNLGSYKNMFYYGWINVDIIDLKQFADGQAYHFLQADVSKKMPFKDNDIDIIFHSHLLEHFNREDGKNFLRECCRVLKPGGILRVSVPDAQLLTKKYLDGSITDYRYVNIGVERADNTAEALYELLCANHKTLYDETSLTKLLSEVGFKEIRRETPFTSRSDTIRKQTINTFPSLSCIIEATPDK